MNTSVFQQDETKRGPRSPLFASRTLRCRMQSTFLRENIAFARNRFIIASRAGRKLQRCRCRRASWVQNGNRVVVGRERLRVHFRAPAKILSPRIPQMAGTDVPASQPASNRMQRKPRKVLAPAMSQQLMSYPPVDWQAPVTLIGRSHASCGINSRQAVASGLRGSQWIELRGCPETS